MRTKAARLIRPVAERLARDAMIGASHECADGGVTVSLSLADGKGEMLSLASAGAGRGHSERHGAGLPPRRGGHISADNRDIYGTVTDMHTYIPQGYRSLLSVYDTQKAIGLMKRLFEDTFAPALNLFRVSAPAFCGREQRTERQPQRLRAAR